MLPGRRGRVWKKRKEKRLLFWCIYNVYITNKLRQCRRRRRCWWHARRYRKWRRWWPQGLPPSPGMAPTFGTGSQRTRRNRTRHAIPSVAAERLWFHHRLDHLCVFYERYIHYCKPKSRALRIELIDPGRRNSDRIWERERENAWDFIFPSTPCSFSMIRMHCVSRAFSNTFAMCYHTSL